MGKKKTTKKPETIDYSKSLKNDHHERFCEQYMIDLNATRSYKTAYPRCSQKTAESNGHILLQKTEVVGRLQYLKGKLSEAAGVTAQMLMDELKKVGFSNIDDYLRIDEDGNVLGQDFDKIDRSKLAAIESIRQTTNITSNKDGDREYETRNFTFKLHNKLNAIADMGKHIGFYEKDNAQRKQAPQTLVIEQPKGVNDSGK